MKTKKKREWEGRLQTSNNVPPKGFECHPRSHDLVVKREATRVF